MSVADVVAQARAALVGIEEAQRGLVVALDRAERGCQLSAQLLLASANHDVVWVVKSAADAAEPLKQAYAAFGRSADLIRRYLDGIAGNGGPGTAPPPPAPTAAGPPAAPPTVGTWRGKTASEYARDKGEGIGRLSPLGRRKVVREVDTADEVREIFDALAKGARRIDPPGYEGMMIMDAEGTIVGFRNSSKSTKDDPALDARDKHRNIFKIHVALKET
ncbi:hypothetical protein [Actinoalloteichus caeruleus]|uniref:hypothetical protein n=2 Tax=Actinoalloteichus cyanogriseus TaxID=2893586 RepID=UPI0004C03027|nr:hypothetical protein [Actinoalloteichus caeruleus]